MKRMTQKIKHLFKEKWPDLYKFSRLVYAFFYVIKKQKMISLNPSLLEHMLYCKWGESKLDRLYNSKFSTKNPLKLSILKIWKLEPKLLPKMYHYNPTLYSSQNSLMVFWRISDFTFGPYLDKYGIFTNYGLERLENYEAIGQADLFLDSSTLSGSLVNERILENIQIVNLEESARSINRVGEPIFIEDPRAHEGDGRFVTAHARFGKVGNNFYRMLMIDLHTLKATIIPGDIPEQTEKNWIVLREKEDSLVMLNRSDPQIIFDVDLHSGNSRAQHTPNSVSERKRLNLNGGSATVLIDSKFYLRVARYQFPVYPIGIARISVLVMHDLDFMEIARSKPFVFDNIGVEICNGLVMYNNEIYFSWGKDDVEMFVGKCDKEQLMKWFYSNLQD